MNNDTPASRSGLDFGSWYRDTYPQVLRAILVSVGDMEVAVEAASEAFARAFSKWQRVAYMESPAGWTFRVALNVARRLMRRRAYERRLRLRYFSTVSPPIPAPSIDTWDAVQRLPPRQRTAIGLYYFADLSQRDVAIAMNISTGTVAATLHSARRALAASLNLEDERTEQEGIDND